MTLPAQDVLSEEFSAHERNFSALGSDQKISYQVSCQAFFAKPLNLAAIFTAFISIGVILFARSIENSSEFNQAISIVVALMALPIFVLSAWESWQRSSFGSNINFQVCSLLALALLMVWSVIVLYQDWHNFYLQSAAICLPIVSLALLIDNILEDIFSERAQKATGFWLDKSELFATRIDGNAVETQVKASTLKLGDICKVRAGEIIAADSIIVSGMAELQEITCSGLKQRRFKSSSDYVYSGSRVTQGDLYLRVINPSADSLITNFSSALAELLSDNQDKIRFAWYESVATLSIIFLALFCGVTGREFGFPQDTTFQVMITCLLLGTVLGVLRRIPQLANICLSSIFSLGALVRSKSELEKLTNLRTVVLDYQMAAAPGQLRVKAFEILDQRIDSSMLISVLLSMLGSSDDEFQSVTCNYLCRQIDRASLLEPKDLSNYGRRGICANVNGIEFTIGNEDFLMERGVQFDLELAETRAEGACYFVAMHDEIVARFWLLKPFTQDARELVTGLKDLGLRVLLFGDLTNSQLDVVGKEIGLELAAVQAVPNIEFYQEKVQALEKAVIYYNQANPLPDFLESLQTISHFDALKWSLKDKSLTLLGADLSIMLNALKVIKKFASIRNQIIWGSLIVGLILFVSGLSSLLGVWAIALCILAIKTMLYKNSERLILE